MKKEIKDIKNLTNIDEMNKALRESERSLLDLRVDNKLRKLKDVKSIKFKRKEVAILKTKIREVELKTNAR